MSKQQYRYLIIGNSTAALAALSVIREEDATGSLAVVSDQRHHLYSPPLLTYVLAGKIPEERMYLRPRDFYRSLNVDTFLGQEAVGLNPTEHEVTLADGATLGYERLLLAVGGTPIVPDLPGADLEGIYSFTRYDDLAHVREYIERHGVKQVVIVGGGMIGVKVAEATSALGLETTLVELQDRILSLALDETGSQLARRALEQHSVRVITGTAVTSLGGNEGRVQSVTLDSGSRLPAQLVIMAVGVRPNTKLAQQAGLSVNRGILIDEFCRTSDPDIYAAGDVTEPYDALLGERRPVAIWPAAHIQGETSGRNMAGGEASTEGTITMNSIQVCGLPTISVGLINPPQGAETLEYLSPDGHSYRRLFVRDDKLVGAVFVGEIERAGIITGLIRRGINVASFREKLIQRDLGLLSLPKLYRKHMVQGPGIEV
jgi:NAD(P)H-nitrite reductase large subunit